MRSKDVDYKNLEIPRKFENCTIHYQILWDLYLICTLIYFKGESIYRSMLMVVNLVQILSSAFQQLKQLNNIKGSQKTQHCSNCLKVYVKRVRTGYYLVVILLQHNSTTPIGRQTGTETVCLSGNSLQCLQASAS